MATIDSGRSQRSRRQTEPRRRWRRLLTVPLLLILLAVLGSSWFDRTDVTTIEIGATNRILLVNDAGPIRIRSLAESEGPPELVLRDSWLIRRPELEQVAGAEGVVIRLSCPTRFPCRSAAELSVAAGTEVVVVSTDGLVEVGRFDGSLTVFSSGEGVALGAISGSTRVVSDGVVFGSDLQSTSASVMASEGDVDITFSRSPAALVIEADGGRVDVVVPNQRFRLDIESSEGTIVADVRESETADRTILVRSVGPVTVRNPAG